MAWLLRGGIGAEELPSGAAIGVGVPRIALDLPGAVIVVVVIRPGRADVIPAVRHGTELGACGGGVTVRICPVSRLNSLAVARHLHGSLRGCKHT